VQNSEFITIQRQLYLQVFKFEYIWCFYFKAENPNKSDRYVAIHIITVTPLCFIYLHYIYNLYFFTLYA